MAFIDYGAILRVDGKFVNKNNDLLMDATETGYIPKNKNILGYVTSGDENFTVSFDKVHCDVFHNEELIKTIHSPFIKQTVYLEGFSTICIERLDKEKHLSPDKIHTWKEWVQIFLFDTWDFTDDEIERFKKRYPKTYLSYLRHIKRIGKENRKNKEYEDRWLATWEYKGKKYEVIYGYGIEPNEEVWNRIKYEGYDFTETERQIIDEWFKEEK